MFGFHAPAHASTSIAASMAAIILLVISGTRLKQKLTPLHLLSTPEATKF